jgi:hypothetical protein
MHKIFVAFFLALFATTMAKSQVTTVIGNLTDSVNNKKLQFSSVSLLRQSDSVLIKYTRTDKDGLFKLSAKDTGRFILNITHPGFADYSDTLSLTIANNLDLGTLYLTPKSKLLEEIIIKKSIAAIRFKGDTMVLKADSFQVREGASVEELLKRMPGFQVDKNGQITAQGERVQKVLVDGEEFFSDDPTIATKNLLANMVDDVEVFDKKSDQANFSGIDDGQKSKTINLKLKENKKNGYFGKVEAGSDMKKFWNNNAMLNYFKGKKKISGYGIMSNNGKTGLNWQENSNFGGLSNMETGVSDDGGMYVMFNNNGDEFDNDSFEGEGIPKSWNTGVNFSNKWDKDAKHLNGNIRFNKLNNEASIQTTTQYILPDTLYFLNQDNRTYNSRNRKRVETFYDVQLDSSASIKATVSGTLGEVNSRNYYFTESLNEEAQQVNDSKRETTNNADNEAFSSSIIYRKKFKKQGHTFSAQARQDYKLLESDGFLLAKNNFFQGNGNIVRSDTIDQEKLNYNRDNSFSARLSYTRPLSKKTYLEFNYGFLQSNRLSDRRTLEKADPTSEKYDTEVELLTNKFKYENTGHTGGINFRYSKPKKISFSIGGSVAKNNLFQKDLRRDTTLQLKFVNFFPRANLNLTMKKNRNLGVFYNGSTQQPTIEQLQPVADNYDPLNISIGNPDLKVAVNHRLGLYLGAYDFLTESGYWANINVSATQDGFGTRDFIDSLGRRFFQTKNVNGIYNVNGYFDYNFKIKKTAFNGGLGLQVNYGQLVNFVNDQENKVRNGALGLSARMGYYKEKKFNVGMSSSFTQNISNASIRTDITTNYWIQVHEFDYGIVLPWKLETGGEVSFNLRQKTSVFDNNTNAILVNLWLERKFLKSDGAKFRLYAFDILNQNIGFRRNISTNYISEKTYNTFNQYVMLSFIWNFNKNGKPMEY